MTSTARVYSTLERARSSRAGAIRLGTRENARGDWRVSRCRASHLRPTKAAAFETSYAIPAKTVPFARPVTKRSQLVEYSSACRLLSFPVLRSRLTVAAQFHLHRNRSTPRTRARPPVCAAADR
jgi:hypothetical protein